MVTQISPPDKLPPEVDAAYEDPHYYLELMGGAKGYDAPGLRPKYARAVHLAKQACPTISRILDLGCGRGEIINWYCNLRMHAVGVEYSDTACRLARKLLANNPNESFGSILQIRDCNLNFPENSFDVVFMLDVVEHLYDSQLDYYYTQIHKLLSARGVFIIHTWPNRLQRETLPEQYELLVRNVFALPYKILFGKEIKRTVRDSTEELVHINEHSPNQLRQQLEKHGFRVKLFTSYFGGRGPDSMADFLGETVLNFGFLGLLPGLKKYLNRHIWAVAYRD